MPQHRDYKRYPRKNINDKILNRYFENKCIMEDLDLSDMKLIELSSELLDDDMCNVYKY